MALDPKTAEEFARKAADGSSGNAQIYPLRHRADKPAVIDLDGKESNLEISATLEDAFDAGYDAVTLRNYTTPEGSSGRTILKLPRVRSMRMMRD